MAAPTMTTGAAGNLLASTPLALAGTATFTVDASIKIESQIQIGVTFGTVAATAGLKVEVFRRIGSTPIADTRASQRFIIAAVAATSPKESITLPTGRWSVLLTNLDGTNGVTAVSATGDTIDGIS